MLNRIFRAGLAALAAVVCMAVAPGAHTAFAQSWPDRPIRLVVPFGAGGPDTTARILGQQLSKQLGQPIIVDNRAGANGIIGADMVAKAAPDGYTLMLTSASFAVNPSMYKKLPYDSQRDFIAIAQVAAGEGLILAVHPGVPATTLAEFLALARDPGSKIAYGSPGIGNTLHLAGERFNMRAGTKMLHVPYKGGGPAAAALLGGEIQAMLMTAPTALPQIRAGKLRALAFTGDARASYLPEVPTLKEAGVPDFDVDAGWHGLFAPANTPPAIVQRLRQEVVKALQTPEMTQAIKETGLVPSTLAPEAFPQRVDTDIAKYTELVRIARVEPE
jgi:tripartite-type tricarboxylate transporter receptor subunit TctC